MPTAALYTYSNAGLVPVFDRDLRAQQHRVKLGNSLTLAKGTVLGQITATGLWVAYASGSADGSQIPRAILAYDTVTDAGGLHTIGGGAQAETYTDTVAFFAGDFDVTDLTGLDATALTNSKTWYLLWGSVTAGVIRLP